MKRLALLVALAACGNKKSMTARCDLGPDGEEVPQQLLARPWLLHDLTVADHLSRRWHCVVRGRPDEKVWSDEPPRSARTHRKTGDVRIAYKLDELGPDQRTLVLRWSDGSASIPVPQVPTVTAEVKVGGDGIAHVTGTVTGTDDVTVAGERATVTGGTFTADLPIASWLFTHATVADLPLEPLPSKLTLLVEAGGPGGGHALVTTPAPRLALSGWIQAVLDEGTPVPYAPPADRTGMARPTVVVMWERDDATGDERPQLRALTRGTPISTVEVVAHVRPQEVLVEKCDYDGDFQDRYVRRRSDRQVVIYLAASGAEVARKVFAGKDPIACPDVLRESDPRLAALTGAPPDELAIVAWVHEQTNPLPPRDLPVQPQKKRKPVK